ncbi:MAG: hypothetical protein A4E34_01825 [Methanoregula sp. PtaU1.Bin006]|nr:MAG: hypothetical protein A4E34_01825 [Methanoregula sp. PtaU1.Bin006]
MVTAGTLKTGHAFSRASRLRLCALRKKPTGMQVQGDFTRPAQRELHLTGTGMLAEEKRKEKPGSLSCKFQDPDRQPRRIVPVVNTNAGDRDSLGHLGDGEKGVETVERPADRDADDRFVGL